MNEDRRFIGQTIVALLQENDGNEISDATHLTVTSALRHMHRREYHQLLNQEKYDGTSDSNTKQVAICRVALDALENAVRAWDKDEHSKVISLVLRAVETDGTTPKVRKKREDSRGRRQVRTRKA